MRRAVEAWVDGELSGQAWAEVAGHLSWCWECRVAAEALRQIKGALRAPGEDVALVASYRLRRFASRLCEPGPNPDNGTRR